MANEKMITCPKCGTEQPVEPVGNDWALHPADPDAPVCTWCGEPMAPLSAPVLGP